MSQEFDDLTAEVAAETTIDASAVTLINGLAAQITALGSAPTPAQLKALTTQMKAQASALAAAVAANTAPAPAA